MVLLFPTENFQIPPSIGTSCPLELSPFIRSMAVPLTSSAPALTSAWLLPSASVNYIQPVIASSYTYQHCSEIKRMTPAIETYVGWQALSQAGCVSQLPEIMESCSSRSTQLLEGRPPTESGGISVGAPVQNSTHSLTLDSSWEQPEKENWDEMRSESLQPLDAHKVFIGTQDPPLLSLASPDSPELLASTEHPIPENPGSEDALLGKCHPSLQDPGTLDKGIESSPGWADIGALVEGIQLPQVLQSLEDLDHSNQLTTIGAQDTDSIQDNGVQVPSAKVRKKKHKASEAITGASEAKLQLMDLKSLPGGKGCVFSAAASDRAPKDTVEKSYRKSPMMPSNRTNQDEGHGKGRAKKTKGNNEKKALDRKQSEPKVKAEDMPTIPNRKRKRHQPVTGQEVLKMPHTSLGMHLLESVQVFHPLGKKLDKKGGTMNVAEQQCKQPWGTGTRSGKLAPCLPAASSASNFGPEISIPSHCDQQFKQPWAVAAGQGGQLVRGASTVEQRSLCKVQEGPTVHRTGNSLRLSLPESTTATRRATQRRTE
ncbi:uncharacterized protein C2orf78 [Heterocephalus glaber]|uniref:Uncharacterized protein C2orf78 n=1 Tax=Heterocephalus glaber TaxID=10181 RepID=A0AAX6THK8_HETGA|nr:uncharacterized protein C2orf78 [Heterocephalus glaber]